MRKVVRLEDIVEAMDLPEEWQSFLDPETGEIVSISEDDRFILESDQDEISEAPEWQREGIARIRRVLDSGRALAVPDSFEIHEWELMRRFGTSVDDADASAELLQAIHGKGAFRLFKMTIDRLDLRDRWFQYRGEALREIARGWLDENGLEYVDTVVSDGS